MEHFMENEKNFEICYKKFNALIDVIFENLSKKDKNIHDITIKQIKSNNALFEKEGDVVLEFYLNESVINNVIAHWLFDPAHQRIVLNFIDFENKNKKYSHNVNTNQKYSSNIYAVECVNHLNSTIYESLLNHLNKINRALDYPYEVSIQRPIIFIDAILDTQMSMDLYVLKKSFLKKNDFKEHISDIQQFCLKRIFTTIEETELNIYLDHIRENFLPNLYNKEIDKMSPEEIETVKMYIS